MPRDFWDCWDDETTTPPTTSEPSTSAPPSGTPEPSGSPEPEYVCYPPRIEELIIQPTLFITMSITKG